MAVTLFFIYLISSSAWALSGPPSQPKKQTPSLKPSAIYADSAKKNFVSLTSVFDSRPLLIGGPFGESTGTDPFINWRPGKLKRYSAPKGEERQIRRGYSEPSYDESVIIPYVQPYQEPREEKPQRFFIVSPPVRAILREVVKPIYKVAHPFRLLRVMTPEDQAKQEALRALKAGKTEMALAWLSPKGRGYAPYWTKRPITEANAYLSRAGRPELVDLIKSIAKDVFEETGQPLFINDLNGRGHRGHKRGLEADILIRLKGNDHFKGGSLANVKGLNGGSSSSFHPGPAYDLEQTIEVIEKFLKYSKEVWLKEGETQESCLKGEYRCKDGKRDRLMPCKSSETGCREYHVEVTGLLTSDPAIVVNLKNYKDGNGKNIVQRRANHSNHFHIKIDFDDTPVLRMYQPPKVRSRWGDDDSPVFRPVYRVVTP